MADSTPTDKKSSPEYFFVRDERISDMAEFSRLLSETIVHYAKGDPKQIAIIGANISTRCPRCEIRLNGDELLAVSQPDEQKTAKVQRMQLGYCPRNGCDSPTCQVCFHRHPNIDWSAFFLQMNVCRDQGKEPSAVVISAEKVALRKERLRKLGRLAIGLGVICLLLMVWQWRRGGRIPLIREPEKFRVTPVNAGQKE